MIDQAKVISGKCFRCHHGALLYRAVLKATGQVVHICYECRELIRRQK